MKIVEHYICEVCGTEYNDKERCAGCEDWHISPIRIEEMQHVPLNIDAQGYPLSIYVRMQDGKTVKYEREADGRGYRDGGYTPERCNSCNSGFFLGVTFGVTPQSRINKGFEGYCNSCNS